MLNYKNNNTIIVCRPCINRNTTSKCTDMKTTWNWLNFEQMGYSTIVCDTVSNVINFKGK